MISPRCMTTTSCSGALARSGCRNKALTIEKIVVLTPMPKASVRMATSVNPGCLAMLRSA